MMLSLLRGLLGRRAQDLDPATSESETPPHSELPVVLSFRVARDASRSEIAAALRPAGSPPDRRHPTLKSAGLGSVAQRRALRSIGIRTTADLLAADPAEVVARLGLGVKVQGTLRRWQRAIRLARRMPGMRPLDALLICAVHRGSVRSLATESPWRLHRDLERFAISSAGARMLGERPVPSRERVRGWVEKAKRLEAARATG